MKTRRDFLIAIPLFLIACTQKKKMTDEEAQKLKDESAQYNKNVDKKLIAEGHPIAMTFKYRKEGNTASANLAKPKSSGVPPEDQVCKNCLYYKAIGDDYGSCQMLPAGNVTANGWCQVWAQQKTQEIPS